MANSGAQTARESRNKDRSIEEMEEALAPRPARRMGAPLKNAAPGATCQVARALLEDNKQMIQDKLDRKQLERKNSLDLHERHIQQDRLVAEGDKARSIGRRHAQKELAEHYLSRIAEKERAKANSYSTKVKSGPDVNYFPFVEGENINKDREAKSMALREELRQFLQSQREERPPRQDSLLAETAIGHGLEYPVFPTKPTIGKQAAPLSARGPGTGGGSLGAAGAALSSVVGSMKPSGDEVAPHLQQYPRFLQRPHEHMSRRLHDTHVRKALEEKVQQTKNELAVLTKKREVEMQHWEEGLQVNDALGVDSEKIKAMHARKNAEELKQQMEERRKRLQAEKDEKRSQVTGYWGPEEKEARSNEVDRQHCVHLIKQMEVDQRRRIEDRSNRLRQEKRLVDNCLAEMTMDRRREAQKVVQHREVLTTTWKSQQKIREVYNSIDAL